MTTKDTHLVDAPKAHHPLPSQQTQHTRQEKVLAPYTSAEAIRRTMQQRRYRKILFHHHVRKNLRQARAYERQVTQRFWMTIASVIFAFSFIFFAITGTGAYATLRFYSDTQTKYIQHLGTLPGLMPLDNLKM